MGASKRRIRVTTERKRIISTRMIWDMNLVFIFLLCLYEHKVNLNGKHIRVQNIDIFCRFTTRRTSVSTFILCVPSVRKE